MHHWYLVLLSTTFDNHTIPYFPYSMFTVIYLSNKLSLLTKYFSVTIITKDQIGPIRVLYPGIL